MSLKPETTQLSKTEDAVNCSNVCFAYDSGHRLGAASSDSSRFGLRDLNLQVKAGEFVLLQGASGSGKTTLLKILGGLIKPERGSVYINGSLISSMNEVQRARFRQQNIGFIFQEANLDHQRTVWQNVMLPLYFGRQSLEEGSRKALKLLNILGMSSYKDVKAACLSGGQKQRVAAIRALLNEPVLLLADEPMAHLDLPNSQILLETLRKMQQVSPVAIVMTAH
ncbi:TPA: hypothetical protein DD394_03190, partial [bacterium UBP9_UBA11836]|nr:hypothetical protein [bacterium UBP9_UBA11836]